MSKKKSYMDKDNILSEGAIKSFLLGLFKGKKRMKGEVAKYKIEVEQSVKDYNKATSKFEKAFAKQFGKKVKFPRQSIDDFINKAR